MSGSFRSLDPQMFDLTLFLVWYQSAFGLFTVAGLSQILRERSRKPDAGLLHHDSWYWLRLHEVVLLTWWTDLDLVIRDLWDTSPKSFHPNLLWSNADAIAQWDLSRDVMAVITSPGSNNRITHSRTHLTSGLLRDLRSLHHRFAREVPVHPTHLDPVMCVRWRGVEPEYSIKYLTA